MYNSERTFDATPKKQHLAYNLLCMINKTNNIHLS